MKFFLRITSPFFLVVICTNVLVIAVLFLMNPRTLRGGSQTSCPLPFYGTPGRFNLLESSGQPLTAESLKGHVWVANFMFTRCQGQCPVMNLKMSALQKSLSPEARLISFSVDPETDTPAILSEYARRYSADPARWLFVTGPKEEMDRAFAYFHVDQSEDPSMHSLRFVLLDPKANIRGYYDSTDERAVQKMITDARSLLLENKTYRIKTSDENKR